MDRLSQATGRDNILLRCNAHSRLPAGEGRDIELRHQRNPDVTFDCLASLEGERRGCLSCLLCDGVRTDCASTCCCTAAAAAAAHLVTELHVPALTHMQRPINASSWRPPAADAIFCGSPSLPLQVVARRCPTRRLWRWRRCCPRARARFWSCGRPAACAAPAGRTWWRRQHHPRSRVEREGARFGCL